MNKKFAFSENEYNSLRTELITRIGFSNNLSNTAITTIIATWTAGLTLLIFLFGQNTQLPNFFRFVNSIVFLIPVTYFIPLAIKSGENLTQITSISAYIRVFFEYLRENSNDEELTKFGWETTNSLVSNINVHRGNKSKILLFCNEEFTILSIASVMVCFISACLHIASIYNSSNIMNFEFIITIIIYFLLAIFAIKLVIVIHHSSCIKQNMMDKSFLFIKAYIYQAYNLNLINKKQVNDAIQKLNPNNEISWSDRA